MSTLSVPNLESKAPLEIVSKSKQSANVFLHCMKKFEYLTDILKNKAFLPRYNEEIIDYLYLSNYKRIAFPMVCFCDIYLNKLKLHMSEYGNYGIGLSKNWGICQGLQPISYINLNSELTQAFKETLIQGISRFNQADEIIPDEIGMYINQILTSLLFIKPIEGLMKKNGKEEITNFHDEKEWRYVPNMMNGTELPLIIPEEDINDVAIRNYSEAIKKCEKLWLNIEYNDIKYLLVKNSIDRDLLIEFIMSEIDIEMNNRYVLISKIIVYNEMEEDL